MVIFHFPIHRQCAGAGFIDGIFRVRLAFHLNRAGDTVGVSICICAFFADGQSRPICDIEIRRSPAVQIQETTTGDRNATPGISSAFGIAGNCISAIGHIL